MNRMKAEGHRKCVAMIKFGGIDAARKFAHELILSANGRLDIDPYVQGYINEFNKVVKK